MAEAAHHAGANAFNVSYDVTIDSTPPEVSVISPARASMITQLGYETADTLVNFEVVDLFSAVTSVSLNDEPIALEEDELVHALVTNTSTDWGLNVLRFSASDACGNTRQTVQSFLRSPSYYDATVESDSGARVANGIVSQFNQSVFDDGNRADVDDLATLAETVMRQTDFDGLISNPVAHSDGFDSNNDGFRDQQTFTGLTPCAGCLTVPVTRKLITKKVGGSAKRGN